jgi:hypothetical protein
MLILTHHSSSLRKIRVEKGISHESFPPLNALLGIGKSALQTEGNTGREGLADEEGSSTTDDDPDD